MHLYNHPRLSIPLAFLSFKDLIQGAMYKHIDDKKKLHILGQLSWLHICYQPLFVNLIASHFSTESEQRYWNLVILLCFIIGSMQIPKLKEFDISDTTPCTDKQRFTCSDKTTGVMGKYHIAYRFRTKDTTLRTTYLYLIPVLFTKAKPLGFIWLIFILSIVFFYRDTDDGEKGAIWCYASIAVGLPIALAHKQIARMILK